MCSKCDTELFHGKSKYDHGSPWPAFSEPINAESLRKEPESQPQTSSDKPAMKVGGFYIFILGQ